MDSKLLQPSLTPESARSPIFSGRAMLLVAFFLGAPGALLFGGLNAQALRRLKQDGWILAAGLIGLVAVVYLSLDTSGADSWTTLSAVKDRTQRLIMRRTLQGYGLAVGLVFFALHRPYSRAAAAWGYRNPWPWVAAAIPLSFLVQIAVVLGVGSLKLAGW